MIVAAMRLPRPKPGLVFLALLVGAGAFAQETTDAQVDETIEEITVMGPRSLAMMRAEIIAAENVVYDLFNELNDDDGYDIICKKETRIGSQLPRRICQARMYREEVADATNDETGPAIPVGNRTRASQRHEVLMDKMRSLAAEHPELLEALKNRYALDQRYKEERAKRYGE